MEEPRPGSGNATSDDFEHVDLDQHPEGDRRQAASAPAAAGAAEQQPAPPQLPEAPAGEDGEAAAAGTSPAAPAPPAAAATEAAPSSPPATKALQSVLGFFSSIASSPPPAAKEQKEAPSAAGGGAPQQPVTAASSEPAVDAAAAAGAGEAEPYDPVAAFESEALEAAERLQHGVEEVGQKLLHGAAEAKESLTSFAQGLSSWWSQLDAATQGSAPQSRSASSRQLAADAAAAAEQLGLESGESVLESFSCRLLQSYTAVSNFFTPVQLIPFPGSLHITSARLCFVFEDKGIAPIKLPAKAIKPGGVSKLAADAGKGLPARLEVALEAPGQKLVLADFALAELELDSALALLEHLAELSDG